MSYVVRLNRHWSGSSSESHRTYFSSNFGGDGGESDGRKSPPPHYVRAVGHPESTPRRPKESLLLSTVGPGLTTTESFSRGRIIQWRTNGVFPSLSPATKRDFPLDRDTLVLLRSNPNVRGTKTQRTTVNGYIRRLRPKKTRRNGRPLETSRCGDGPGTSRGPNGVLRGMGESGDPA